MDYRVVEYFNEGVNYAKLGRYTEAIVSFDKAIAINPNDADVWNNHGNALYCLGRYTEAVASFEKAIAINPNNAMMWNNRGNALYYLERYDEAVTSCDKALTINSNYSNALFSRGSSLSKLGRNDEAIASYDKALTINPNDADVWNNHGNALYSLGRYTEAVASYDKAIAINPNDAVMWNNRGNALYHLERYDEAIASFDKAIAIKKKDREKEDKNQDLIFISSKSEDFDHTHQVYTFLKDRGYNVFFSQQSLPNKGSSDYRKEIDRSLDDSKHMIVVTSKKEYVASSWVEAEWGLFINEKRSGRKSGNIITLIIDTMRIEDLPSSLRYYEVIPFDPKTFEKILKYLK